MSLGIFFLLQAVVPCNNLFDGVSSMIRMKMTTLYEVFGARGNIHPELVITLQLIRRSEF